MTLTIRNIPDAEFGRQNVRELRSFFTKLRRRVRFVGGFYVVQVTNSGKGWHLHLHVLYDGHYLPQDALSRIWAEITAGSFIVDIQKVDNPKLAVRYLLTDFLQAPRIRPEDVPAFNSIFRGCRLVQPFGKYRNVKFRAPFPCPHCGRCEWINLSDLLGERRRFIKVYDSS